MSYKSMKWVRGICFLLKTPSSWPSNRSEVSRIGLRPLRRVHIIKSPVCLRGQWPPFPDRTKCMTINFNDNVGDVQNNVNKREQSY